VKLRGFLTHPLLWTALLFIVLPYVAGANPFTGNWSGFVGIATTRLSAPAHATGRPNIVTLKPFEYSAVA
jgi:hypothetical protein